MHLELLRIEEDVFQALGSPTECSTSARRPRGPAYRKFDLEAWMPGRGEGGEYGEVTSTSIAPIIRPPSQLPLQARRQKGTKFVHTLNGTAIA